ncbi:hypothetical protein C5167_021845 [Papaver somniferum]|uniref:Uncharacterized protein n=1 Tax=Papaver somniferum TaxID=3469 RepID=A0A4Y7JG66_PAPSO|nr:hypothetical protein C5167_021845 [Papaver somniferum]
MKCTKALNILDANYKILLTKSPNYAIFQRKTKSKAYWKYKLPSVTNEFVTLNWINDLRSKLDTTRKIKNLDNMDANSLVVAAAVTPKRVIQQIYTLYSR